MMSAARVQLTETQKSPEDSLLLLKPGTGPQLLRMEKTRSGWTEMILDLSLEIICLLTGEKCAVVKMASIESLLQDMYPAVSGGWNRRHNLITVPSPQPPIPERNEQKILEVTNKIIELLTGEGLEHLEDSKDVYKDEKMENDQNVTSPSGSCNINIPERSTGPLYSDDSAQEHHSIPHHYQGWDYFEDSKDMYKDSKSENEQTLTSPHGSSNRNLTERCPSPLYSQDSAQEDHIIPHHYQSWEYSEGSKDLYKDEKMENQETLKSPNGPRNLPERCPITLYSHDDLPEGHTTPYQYPREDLFVVKLEEEEEENQELYLRHEEEEINRDVNKESASSELHADLSPQQETRETNTPQEPLKTAMANLKILDTLSDFANNLEEESKQSAKSFPCTECDKSFTHNCQLVRHQRIHTGERPYPCAECGRHFTQESDLTKHQVIHQAVRPFTCPECGKGFTQKSNLIEHLRTHRGEKPYHCTECGYRFTQKSHLIRHWRTHTGEKPFPCEECGKGFCSKSSLIQHQRIHRGEKPFSCNECGRCFTQDCDLHKHQLIHRGVKPFTCSQCGKCFTQKSNLLEHERTHRGEKPYRCTECGYRFTQKSHLIRHWRTHTGEKPFPCHECGKGFSSKSALIQHQRIHSGEKPFSCNECGKSFRQKSNMVKHVIFHARDNIFCSPTDPNNST